jgi:hypothetical protein
VTWHVEWTEEFRRLPEAIGTFQIDALGDVVRLTVSEFHPEGIDEKYLEGDRRGWPVTLPNELRRGIQFAYGVFCHRHLVAGNACVARKSRFQRLVFRNLCLKSGPVSCLG